jgi:PAS domain S-box-containing protein
VPDVNVARSQRDQESTGNSSQHDRDTLADLERFRCALEASQVGVWSWDLRSNLLTWSSNLETHEGVPERTADGAILLLPDALPRLDCAGLIGVINKTLESRAPARVEYRLPGASGRDERWFEALATPFLENGDAVRLLGVCRDVTERLRVYREVRVRARQQETLGKLSDGALTETDLQKFFNDVVATVGEILDVELVKILELLPGDAELLLRAGIGWKPGCVGTAHISTGRESQAGYALASGRPVIAEDLSAETRFRGEPLLHDHGAISGISAPIAGHDGRAYGVLGAHTGKRRKFTDYEISFLASAASIVAGAIQRRQLDQRHELMIRELRHRSGNLFSQLLALFSQTAKNSRSVADLVTKYEARVLALANAHRLITEGGWKSTSLNDLLQILLAPFLDRVSFRGPNVFLEPDPTFGLSMAVHELLTNASKHGSLAGASGRVELAWSVTRTEQGLTLVLDWVESSGPAPKPDIRPGFGSRLINMVIERQLNGRVKQRFESTGLHATLTVPLTHERWPGAVRAATGGVM